MTRYCAGKWRVQEDTKGSENHCILRLEQSLALSLPMPPPFDKILKYITCRQVRDCSEFFNTAACNTIVERDERREPVFPLSHTACQRARVA